MPSEAAYTSNLRVREYNPNGPPQSKPIRPEQWKRHEERIRSLHAAKYKRAEALEKLKAECGCEHNCSFNPSPSQYSAQLKEWGLRTYKTKGTVPTNTNRRETGTLFQRQTETSLRSPTCKAYSEAGEEPRTQSYLGSETLISRSTSIDQLPIFEGPEDRVHSDLHQTAVEALHPDSALLNEDLHFPQEDGDDDQYSERSSLPPWVITLPQSAQSAYPRLIRSPRHFINSGTIHDAVRRVVQALSKVFADPELEHFLDNLNDTELEELLIDPGKLKEACDTALVKYTGKVFRLGESFGPRPVRLIEIRDALETRARCLYWSTPQTASVDSDQSAKAPTNSSLEQPPATHYGDSNETVAIQIHNEDTPMQQDLLEIVDEVYDSKKPVPMSKTEPISCSACVAIPSVDYRDSLDASRLWSEVNSRQDTLKAIDEIHVMADCYFAARLYADAFDLYYLIWTKSDVRGTYIRGSDYMLAVAFSCARSSATPLQDACVEMILHQAFGMYLFSFLPDVLRESMLHSFLGDLYERLKIKTNAEVHLRKAMLHLDENDLSNLDKSFPNHHHITIALERQITNRQRNVSQAIGYNASIVPTGRISKCFAAEIQNGAFLEDLLAWCAVIIHENARGLDAFRSVLPKQPLIQRGFICRTLLCFLIERWLSERQRSSSPKDTIATKVLAGFECLVSPPEALSAIAMLITHDCPDQNRPPPPWGRHPSGTLSSSLLKNTKELIKLKSNRQTFSEVYLRLMTVPGEVRSQPLDHKSRTMLCLFMMNVAPTSLVNRQLPSRGVGSHNSLVPSPDLFREYEIQPASCSPLLYSPHSSFSSGLNSIRETATEAIMRSVLSLTRHRSETSSSMLPDEEIMDHEVGIIHQATRDEEMVDV